MALTGNLLLIFIKIRCGDKEVLQFALFYTVQYNIILYSYVCTLLPHMKFNEIGR